MLKQYAVHLREKDLPAFSTIFRCEAEDDDHAREQAANAYPGCDIYLVTTNYVPQYVVVNDNTLGYRYHERDTEIGCLSASVIGGSRYQKGVPFHVGDCDPDRVRPATTEDFARFRVSVPSSAQLD